MWSFTINTKGSPYEEIAPEILRLVKRFYPDFQIVQNKDLDQDLQDFLREKHLDNHPTWIKSDFNGDGINDYAVLLWKKEIKKKGLVHYYRKFVIFVSKNKSVSPVVIYEDEYENISETNECIPLEYRKSKKEIFLQWGSDEECKHFGVRGNFTTVGKRRVPVVKVEPSCIPESIKKNISCGFYIPWRLSILWYLREVPAGNLIKHTKAFAPPPGKPEEVFLKFPAVEWNFFERAAFVIFWDLEKKGFESIQTVD